MAILVTGASGLVGFELVETLRGEGEEVVGTCRRPAAGSGDIAWDMSAEPAPAALRRRWTAVVHTAADTRWTQSDAEAASSNVDSVRALEPVVGPGTHLVHVSTAYSVGIRGDGESPRRQDYRNSYEWSKAHGERLVRASFADFTIVRPPLIIGRRGDGRAARFSGMYTLLRALATSMVPVVIADPDAYLELVPVDDVAAGLIEAVRGGPAGRTETIAGGADAPTVAAVIEAMTGALNSWREGRDLEPLDVPRVISRESWDRFFGPFVRDELSPRQQRIFALLNNFEPYLMISEPLRPSTAVADPVAAIGPAVRHWADAEPSRAGAAPRPWRAAA